MYHHLRGEIVELSPTKAVVDVGGVGYDLLIPLSTYDQLKGQKDVSLLTYLHVREDDLRLFGFATKAERELFRLVLSVAGVGPAIALAALSALSPREAGKALAQGDVKTIQRVKGVGRKLAERMAVELRDRVEPILSTLGVEESARGQRPEGEERILAEPEAEDAVKALMELGYDRKVARERVGQAYKHLTKVGAPEGEKAAVTVENLVRASLQMG